MLSAVVPTVVKLQLGDLAETGAVVGRLSAWATAGALAGTFCTGFVLVPLLPVRATVIGLGALLVLGGSRSPPRSARSRVRRSARLPAARS